MTEFLLTYDAARDQFLAAAESAGMRTMRHRLSHEDSPELFQDYALLKRDPNRWLVHVSGTHGVEGYAGSAVQRAILSTPFSSDGPSLLFLHALNPYGMAFYRRANGQNVDLNRNFRTGPAQTNPDYSLFDSYLNPKNRRQFLLGLASGFYQSKRIGLARTTQAVASGQVAYPRGLFYMGDRVQREILLLQELLRAHLKEAEEIVFVDVHTGLGKYLHEMLFVDQKAEDPSYFTKALACGISTSDPSSGIYDNQGKLSDAVRAAAPVGAKVHCVLQEFGARSAFTTIGALREENFEWHQRPAGALRPERVRESMLHAFCPTESQWRKNVLALGVKRWTQLEDFLRRSSAKVST